MNIFVLDTNTVLAAKYHCDRHVIKMILETAQLLCGVHWINGNEAPYRLTHKNHPCSLWVRESIQNYEWLCDLGLELCKEYTKRYNKIHKTQSILEWCKKNKPKLPEKGLTTFALAMPDEYKKSDAVESYRSYYKGSKAAFATWKTDIPPWW